MPIAKVGIVYSIAQGVRRRVIVLDHPGAVPSDLRHHQVHLHPGEGWMEISGSMYSRFKGRDIDRHIEKVLGYRTSDRHVIAHPETGEVQEVLLCDPEIDIPGGVHRNTELHAKYHGHHVIQHDRANKGHIHRGGKFYHAHDGSEI